MNVQEIIKNKSLLEWVFAWNQLRLVIAGATLVLAKQSPILMYLYIPLITPLAASLMSLAWIISGLAGAYLIYAWNKAGRTIFGGNERKDVIAFWIATITGVHLGIAGLVGLNIGFSVTPMAISTPIMIAAGLAYFWSAYHLHSRGGAKKLFATTAPTTEPVPAESTNV